MYRENYINSLRTELLEMVAETLTPVAVRYGYSDVPLETNIKWRPLVLVLGNYSSGKSTLINDFLGASVQSTGQAPTDDSFTVITFDDAVRDNGHVEITDQRDGKFLLNDPEYPFDILKKHGQRFASHFQLKKVNSPFLRNLAIIDTPGMLDSITERDRGYDYQEVIGDFAQLADLVLVIFDPHKAGTVREAHTSLRETLPARTFEDRVLFVLNRVDECASLIDLLRVYGTLCWNLSQITGRKDIPTIHLTYSSHAVTKSIETIDKDLGYLKLLENQREELKNAILLAPKHRLDHLATFIETHGERLSHFLEALMAYRKKYNRFRLKSSITGLLFSLLCGGGALAFSISTQLFPQGDLFLNLSVGGGVTLILFLLWTTVLMQYFSSRFHRKRLQDIDTLTQLGNQTRKDSWESIRDLVDAYLKKTKGNFPQHDVKKEYNAVHAVYQKGSKEIREALNELAAIAPDEPPPKSDSL